MEKIADLLSSTTPQFRERLLVGIIVIATLLGFWYSNASKPAPEEAEPISTVSFQAEYQVHVTGAVNAPGLYKLVAGSRVQDAVVAAGGLADGALESSVNLARLVSDGEQILVLHENQIGAAAGQYLSLNRASAKELEDLPGIGPSTAEKIIAHRDQIGSFSAVEQLLEVPGIGPKLFDQIRDQLTL